MKNFAWFFEQFYAPAKPGGKTPNEEGGSKKINFLKKLRS
jgi:hypothetical protein